MKKYFLYTLIALIPTSCSDFLDLQPEFQVSESAFYKTPEDFETALIGNYADLQNYNLALIYLGDLTTDNAEIQWTSPTVSEVEADEVNFTPANGFVNTVWNTCFSTISGSNNILSRIDALGFNEEVKNQLKGESLFLRAYSYFHLVRIFGDVPIVEVAFRSPNEIQAFDMSRKPVSQVYDLIIRDLTEAATLLEGVEGLTKSRASTGAAKTLLGKVYLTLKQYDKAATVLKEVIDSQQYSLVTDYKKLFTNGNEGLSESIFEIEYLSGNVDEGNSFSGTFTPARFDMAIFPGNMQGSGRILPTPDMANAYEPDDLRRSASIGDSVLLVTGNYEDEIYGLKFVDFTTGIQGDGGINFTALRYADVLLMYAEALNEGGGTEDPHTYINMVRDRADLLPLSGLTKEQMTLALEQERRVEFFLEGHRWFDLVRTGRLADVMNTYFANEGLNFSVAPHEWILPIPLREIDIDPELEQNPNY
jgi:starch-binding outer membrane protein, SusD/RagB family